MLINDYSEVNSNMIKISILGDIMCEKEILNKKNPESTDFSNLFSQISPVLKDSDYVIGNLESVFAGKSATYTNSMYSFNTPDVFLDQLATLPVNLVTTANNHSLDRGIEGINRTIDQLTKRKIRYTGTRKSKNESPYAIITINGIRIAIFSFTASVNYFDHHFTLTEEDQFRLNLLLPQDFGKDRISKLPKSKLIINRFITKLIGNENLMKIKKTLGRKHNSPYQDNYMPEEFPLIEPYAENVKLLIKQAKKEADLVMFFPHMGGQFNQDPGSISEFYMRFIAESGADIIISNHPHIIQKMDYINEIPCFYSIGNYSMYPDSTYIIKDNKPQIGLITNIYINKTTAQISKISIIPIVMKIQAKQMTISPLFVDKTQNEVVQIIDWISQTLEVDLKLEDNEFTVIKQKTN